MYVPHAGLPAGGPELVCDPGCLWRETNLRGDRRSERETEDHHQSTRTKLIGYSRQRRCEERRVSYLLVNQRGERQVVEQVCEVLPDVGVAVLPQTLVIEAVDLCDLSRLVVPSQDGDSLWETNLNRRKRKLFCWNLILNKLLFITKTVYGAVVMATLSFLKCKMKDCKIHFYLPDVLTSIRLELNRQWTHQPPVVLLSGGAVSLHTYMKHSRLMFYTRGQNSWSPSIKERRATWSLEPREPDQVLRNRLMKIRQWFWFAVQQNHFKNQTN